VLIINSKIELLITKPKGRFMKKALSIFALAIVCVATMAGTAEARHCTRTTVVYREPVPQRVYVEERVIVPQERVYVQERRVIVPERRVYVERPADVVIVERREEASPASFFGGAVMGFVLGALTTR
jgi:hypothetical protein